MADPILLSALIALGGTVAVPVLAGAVSKASGGPLRTRRSKRLLEQVAALEEQAASGSEFVKAAAFQHKEALLKEMARAQFSYSPAWATVFIGGLYSLLGFGANGTENQTEPAFLVLAAFMAVAAIFVLIVVTKDRRAMVQRGLGDDSSPYLPPIRQHQVNKESSDLKARDQAQLDRALEHEKTGDNNLQWLLKDIGRFFHRSKTTGQ